MIIDRGRERSRGIVATAVVALVAGCGSGRGAEEAPTGGAAGLSVTPTTGLTTMGVEGGELEPVSQAYTLANTGSESLEWRATSTGRWVELSELRGVLAPGEETVVMASVERYRIGETPAGRHTGTISFQAAGKAAPHGPALPVVIDVFEGDLEVTPYSRIRAVGALGGPFLRSSQEYVLRNDSDASMSWTALSFARWLTVSETSGVLAPGAATRLTVAVDAAAASRLPVGTHTDTVLFFKDSIPLPVAARGVNLEIRTPPSGSLVDSVSQFGITWTFDQPYEAGQFANGDWWVVGPVAIIDIDPPSTRIGERTRNGSMINPSPFHGWTQGYDSAMYGPYAGQEAYSAARNAAFDVSAQDALIVQPHSSLVSTISAPEAGVRPQLSSAAILTVLGAPAPPGSFRPAYSSENKAILFHERQLDYSVLADLEPVSSTPHLAEVERWFERPWIDHVPDWLGRYAHPAENMPDYGREICDRIGIASLMLNLDFTDDQKRKLLVGLVQVGIDLYGIVKHGGEANWPAGGGHHSGRKWPILFAGLVLGDPEMAHIGFRPVAFNEDDQTFYVEETSPGVYNYGVGGYEKAHLGMPEWGGQHWKQIQRGQEPFFDDVDWYADPYRLCCTANVWWGELLAARIMGARELWNHEALFDYQDRYRRECTSRGILDYRLAWSRFPYQMWQAYRSSF